MATNAKSFCQRTISVHVWRKHKEAIRFNINTAIVPSLVQENLIPIEKKSAYKISDLKLLDCERKDVIVDSVPKCGQDDFLVKFITCLRATAHNAGEAHTQLADLLEKDYTEVMEKGLVQETFTQSVIYDPETGIQARTTSVTSDVVVREKGMPHLVGDVSDGTNAPCRYSRIYPSQDENKCIKALKANWKWALAYFTSFMWLVLGAIGVIVLTHVPAINKPQPAEIVYQENLIINVDLGIAPFWLSNALFSTPMAPSSCTSELYALPISCQSVPTIETNETRNTLPGPPYYLLENSQWTITVNVTTDVWVLPSYVGNCDPINRHEWDCTNPIRANFLCETLEPGESRTYTMNTTGYYALCTNIGFFNSINPFVLKQISYNFTAIREMYQHNITVSQEEQTLKLAQDFHFQNSETCLVMDADDDSCYNRDYNLDTVVDRRKDILMFPVLFCMLGFILHLLITGLVHFCFIRFQSESKN